MKKRLIPVIVFLTIFVFPAIAGDSRVITLSDGSIINGQIVGIENGRYVVVSPTAGELKLKQSDVVNIATPGALPVRAPSVQAPQLPNNNATLELSPSSPYADQVQAVQTQIMNDPALLADIQALAQDPEMLAAFSDPAFMQAIQSGNTQDLQTHPQFQRILANPKMLEFIQRLHPQQQ